MVTAQLVQRKLFVLWICVVLYGTVGFFFGAWDLIAHPTISESLWMLQIVGNHRWVNATIRVFLHAAGTGIVVFVTGDLGQGDWRKPILQSAFAIGIMHMLGTAVGAAIVWLTTREDVVPLVFASFESFAVIYVLYSRYTLKLVPGTVSQ